MKEHQDWACGHSLIEGEDHQTQTRNLSYALLHIPAALTVSGDDTGCCVEG